MANINTDCIALKSVDYSSSWQNALFLQFPENGQSRRFLSYFLEYEQECKGARVIRQNNLQKIL